jgi:hypothetical protein
MKWPSGAAVVIDSEAPVEFLGIPSILTTARREPRPPETNRTLPRGEMETERSFAERKATMGPRRRGLWIEWKTGLGVTVSAGK